MGEEPPHHTLLVPFLKANSAALISCVSSQKHSLRLGTLCGWPLLFVYRREDAIHAAPHSLTVQPRSLCQHVLHTLILFNNCLALHCPEGP